MIIKQYQTSSTIPSTNITKGQMIDKKTFRKLSDEQKDMFNIITIDLEEKKAKKLVKLYPYSELVLSPKKTNKS